MFSPTPFPRDFFRGSQLHFSLETAEEIRPSSVYDQLREAPAVAAGEEVAA